MSKQTEALKLALVALESCMGVPHWPALRPTITAIREALAEQPAQQQEPVCDKDPQGCWSVRCQLGKVCKNKYPPASKPWVGLTENERETIRDSWRINLHDQVFFEIEAKLKEKNHG